MLMIPHCLDNRFSDGDELVILTHRPRFTAKRAFSVSGTNVFVDAEKTTGPSAAERIGQSLHIMKLTIIQYFAVSFLLSEAGEGTARCILRYVLSLPTPQTSRKGQLYLKNAVFWHVTPCGSCENRRCSETPVLTRTTQRQNPEDGILHSRRRENLKSYTVTSEACKFLRESEALFVGINTAQLEAPLTESYRKLSLTTHLFTEGQQRVHTGI
jgi:hypothetical protein